MKFCRGSSPLLATAILTTFSFVSSIPPARAGDEDPPDYKHITLPEAKSANEQLQFATGWNAGFFGGADLAETGNITSTGAGVPGGGLVGHTRNVINGVAGMQGGFTWNGWTWEGLRFLPALDAELFWTGSDYKALGSIGATTGTLTADLNSYVFSIDPKIKLDLGRIRPYIGFGVGAAYMTVDRARISAPAVFSAGPTTTTNDVVVALQGLSGIETFLTKNWALDIRYKYVDLIDPTFGGGTTLHIQGHSLGEHIVTCGVNYYF